MGSIKLPSYNPAGIRQVPFQDSIPGLKPVQIMGLDCPEGFRVFQGTTIFSLIAPERPGIKALFINTYLGFIYISCPGHSSPQKLI
jgi:hypothetical protein